MSTTGAQQPRGGVGATVEQDRPEMLLRVSHLAKAFGATQAVRDCSFELRAGEVRALVGENGCGKSTVVKILRGVPAPEAGTVEIGGEPMALLRAPRQAQRLGIVT